MNWNLELFIADKGYHDCHCSNLRENLCMNRLFTVVRARNESMKRRMKHITVLRELFKHYHSLNSNYFHTLSHLTQISIDSGERQISN